MHFLVSLFLCINVSIALAQGSTKEERTRQVEGFVHFYVYPRDICAAAGPDSLARLDVLLANVRKEQLHAFDLVEGSREYIAVVTAMRRSEDQLARTQWARRNQVGECAHLFDLFPRMYLQHKQNNYFEYMAELFSKPI